MQVADVKCSQKKQSFVQMLLELQSLPRVSPERRRRWPSASGIRAGEPRKQRRRGGTSVLASLCPVPEELQTSSS